MKQRLELGVFIPIGNNGWIISKASPQYMPTFELNRNICQLAERYGLDFVFSMSKWRGYDGETKYWNYTLESTTLMAALAAATKRVRILGSVQPLLFAPPVAAKMAATIDDISGGRFGVNIVTGAFMKETQQMGLLPDGYDSFRYDYAKEWVRLVKRLWTEESVTYHGKYFNLEDCRCDPKPRSQPYPDIVCAGISENGMAFTAEEGTHAFLCGINVEDCIELSRRMKVMAREFGRQVKTYTVFTVVQGETDGQAQELVDSYVRGADKEALDNVLSGIMGFGRASGRLFEELRRHVFYGHPPLPGSPRTVASTLARLARDGELDGVMFCFPDFIERLHNFHREVMPLLEGEHKLR
jgi:pyrimidine oxygenase